MGDQNQDPNNQTVQSPVVGTNPTTGADPVDQTVPNVTLGGDAMGSTSQPVQQVPPMPVTDPTAPTVDPVMGNAPTPTEEPVAPVVPASPAPTANDGTGTPTGSTGGVV